VTIHVCTFGADTDCVVHQFLCRVLYVNNRKRCDFASPVSEAVEEDEVDSQFGDASGTPSSDRMDGITASSVSLKPSEADMMEVADLLRQVGDQVQAHYGEEIERIIQNIDWLMPRATLLQEFHRLSSDFLRQISDGWIRVMYSCAQY
jgi:hypothetical protein